MTVKSWMSHLKNGSYTQILFVILLSQLNKKRTIKDTVE